MKASFDVTFVPMANVTAEVQDPRKITEEEQENIIALATEAIRENFREKISGENLAEIRLYSMEDREVPAGKEEKVFDAGLLHSSANPIDESVKLLTDLANSGYMPFSSPAPCSTEVKLKRCITSAISLLENAQMFERDLGYRRH